MIIGITGNSGTGKTILCNKIKESINDKTVSIFDADKIVRELAVPNEEYFNKIVELFGNEILTYDGNIDRIMLAKIIFNDPKKREELNKITYKYIGDETKRRIKNLNSDISIIDAPLLIESNLSTICDVVISLISDKEIKLERICARDSINFEDANLRLSSQKEDEFYIKNSNYVIINNNNTNIEKITKDVIEFLNSNCYNENIVIVQSEDLKILQFKRLLEFKNLIHAFTLKPLDFASNSTFDSMKENVIVNYKLLCKVLGVDYKNIVRSYQTHTNNVVKVEEEKGIFPSKLMDVDGLVTKNKERFLSLVFADCTPLFLYDKEKNIIANIHSGWQGTVKKIAKEAVDKMINEFNSNPKDIICMIGPTIRKCHFEVEEDTKNKFTDSFKDIEEEEYITKANDNKYYIDTVYLNKSMLNKCGIPKENIIDSNICTVCSSNLMHSFRAQKERAGRSTSIIGMQKKEGE